MQYNYNGIITEMQSRLSLLSNWTRTLYLGVYQRIIDVIAYVLDKFIYLAEIYYRESGWNTALRTESLTNQAYFLQYKPYRNQGAIGYVEFSGDPNFSNSYIYSGENTIIPKWTVITSTSVTQQVFVSDETIYYKNTEGNLSVPVTEGTPKTYTYTAQGIADESILIYSNTIENNNIEVWVVDINDTLLYQVNVIDNLYFAPDMISYYCQVNNASDFSYIEILFGNGIDALQLNTGDRIKIFFAETLGVDGDISSSNVLTNIASTIYDTLGNEVTLYCTNTEAITGGTSVEDIESIRNNAPNLYQTGYRLGCENDWISTINSVSYVELGSAWGIDSTGGSTLTAAQQTVYITALNTDGNDLTAAQLNDLTLNVLYPIKSITETVTYQPVEKIYIGVSGIVQLTDNITQADALGQIQTAISNKYSALNTTFASNAYETKISATIDNIAGVIQHKSDYFNVQKDKTTTLGVVQPLTRTETNIQLYPIYSGAIVTDNISVLSNSCKLWVDDGINNTPILIANESGGVFYNAYPAKYNISGVISYTAGNNSCTYNISSGTVSSVYLTYKTKDGLGYQSNSIRVPQKWQITDVDTKMLLFSFGTF